jgi:hypothetical protein
VVLALKRKQLEEDKLIKEEEDEVNENTKYKRSEKNKDRFVQFSDFFASILPHANMQI